MEANGMFASVTPFTGEMPNLPGPVQETTPAIMADVAAQREIAEVQAAMAIAKKYPRNQAKALDRIMVACQRPSLAEKALYSYARGGTDISGPSIRLAEAIAQQWGNLQIGIREIDQRAGESTVEAYAWDLETNTRQSKVFQVRHIRYTRKGVYSLEDPRDVYETVANQGARRLRACILGIIPGDVVEAAVDQCEATLKAKADISPEAVNKMVVAFEAFSVSRAQLEARIQRRLEAITAAQVIALRKIYNSMRDGMSKAADWFDETPAPAPQPDMTPKATKGPGRPKKEPPAPQPQAEANMAPAPATATQGQDERITPEQGSEIEELCKAKNFPIVGVEEDFAMGTVLHNFTRDQAEKAIAWLKELE